MKRFETIALACLFFASFPVFAHPLEKCHFDRNIEVRVEPNRIRIQYTLELSQLSMALDGQHFLSLEDLSKVQGQDGLARLYAEKKLKLIAGGSVLALVNGNAVKLRIADNIRLEHVKKEGTDIYKIVAEIHGQFHPVIGMPNTLEFVEDTEFVGVNGNKALEADGNVTLKLIAGSVVFIQVTEPNDLNGKSLKEIALPEDQSRRRRASASFTVDPKDIVESSITETDVKVELAPDHRNVFARFLDRGPVILLESDLGIVVLLLLAAGFGAAHAFTPGHGKTMVAAFLVGERGTIKHALVLGITATLAHTGSVILVALLVYGIYGNTPPVDAQGWLMIIGGLLIVLVGFWLLMQRLRGQADHVHLFSHRTQSENRSSSLGWLRVILMGLGGGIIPCWDAVLLFLLAMAQGKIGLAIPLLLAFSVGLAIVLVMLGIGVVLAHRAGGVYFRERRWFKALPILSALIILAFGIWFLREGYQLISRGIG